MSHLLQTIAAYVPPNITRATLSVALPQPPTDATAERFPAAILFADVSGFTPLTEALAQKGLEGPEELTRLLNAYFSRMITLIEAEGGEVVKFSGDALTVMFPAASEDLSLATRRAWQAAQSMQAAMSEFATLQTSVGPVALGMKIGIGAGEVVAARVGGVSGRWEYLIAGDPLRQVAQAEHQAGRGEIVLSPEAAALLPPRPIPAHPLAQPDWAQVQNPEAVEAVLKVYVPQVVTAWLGKELAEWLAVLRPMSVLFIGIHGIDYAQARAVEQLNNFLRATQESVYRYEGSINKLAVDDKGTIVLVLFGAPPYAHENDPERAVRCAVALEALAESQGLQLAIGVTHGRVFAGPVGSDTRREYTVMGDPVNLAARLMSLAGPGQVYADYETYRNTHGKLVFDLLPPVRVKGKAGLLRIYRPTGEADKSPGRKEETQSALVGRQAELARLVALLDAVQAGGSHILLIEGEAGIGKSRLVDELVRLIRERGVAGLLGMGRSIEQQTPYRAWRDIFISYFALEEVENPAERQRRIQAQIHDQLPDLVERLPLLNEVLNLAFPESELTASLDTQLRNESLVTLLLALLRAWAAERPLVLVLEDAQWLDSLSWDLTIQAARALTVAHVPLLLVVVMRPLEGEAVHLQAQALANMEQTGRLLLNTMSPEEILALTALRLGVAVDGLPEAVAELVTTRANGNPFFTEELVYFLRDHGLVRVQSEQGRARCLVSGDLSQATLTLPDTIQGLVLSRIDRLAPEEQLTLKVAAVIGRTFGFTILRDTLGAHMEVSERVLKIHLSDLANLEFTPLEAPEPELTYIFKHIITQEVAYQTLLFAQRRQLNRTVAEWYERTFGGDRSLAPTLASPLAPYYPLLAFHWHQAEDLEHERRYARLAGQWAAAQFANVEAVSYFSRALALTPQADREARYELLLARESVNDLQGGREAQARDLAALAELVEQLDDNRRRAQVALRQANYAEAMSNYPAALAAAQRAIAQATQAQDPAAETEGYAAWGKTLWRQGDYEAARAYLERALSLARSTHQRQAEARGLYYLGHVYLYQGNYPAAQAHIQQALGIYHADGHRQGEADSLSNLGTIHQDQGDYPAARDRYEQALSIHHATGDRRGEAIALTNLGNVYADLGDYAAARDYHERALALWLTLDDRYGEAASLVNLGLGYHNLGEHAAARRHCEQALLIQRQIGDRRGEGYSLTFLAHALAGLGDLLAAGEAYTEALQLRRTLGQNSLAMDDLAGLARVALAQGNREQALAQAEEIADWVDAHGLEGMENPLQVGLTCYQVLSAPGQGSLVTRERAHAILSRAHAALLERATRISNVALRSKFLEDVKVNQEIIAAWTQVASHQPAQPDGSSKNGEPDA